MRAIILALALLLTACGERATTYDPQRGRYVDTEEFRRDQINREIDKRSSLSATDGGGA